MLTDHPRKDGHPPCRGLRREQPVLRRRISLFASKVWLRSSRLKTLAVWVVLAGILVAKPAFPQAKTGAKPVATPSATSPAGVKPRIRAITAFINLDRATYLQQVTEALTALKRARTIFESRGYEVQTIRIATQPFPEYAKGLSTQQAIAFFKDYDALAQKEKFAACIGPAMLNPGD